MVLVRDDAMLATALEIGVVVVSPRGLGFIVEIDRYWRFSKLEDVVDEI